MIFDLEYLKNNIRDSVRTYIYPSQTVTAASGRLNTYGTLSQRFYPFSSTFSEVAFYVSNSIGTPSSVNIEIASNGATVWSGSTIPSAGWNTIPASVGDVVSVRPHTFSVSADSIDVNNDYWIGMCTGNQSYFYGTLPSPAQNLSFKVEIPDKVYNIYPGNLMTILDSLPLAVVDVTGKPLVTDEYIHGDVLKARVAVEVEVFSKYPTEVDRLCYGIERGLTLNRKDFLSDVWKVTPIDLGRLDFISRNIYYRRLVFDLETFITRE